MAARRRFFQRFNVQIIVYSVTNIAIAAVGVALFVAKFNGMIAQKMGAYFTASTGLALIAAGITGITMTGYVLVSDTTRNRIRILTDFGVRDYFEQNTTAISGEYSARLNKKNRQIDILALGLSKLRTDHADQFETWAKNGSVRILLLDPEYPSVAHAFAALRDDEEQSPAGKISGEVEKWLEISEDLRRTYPTKFQIRLSQGIPTLTMVRVGNEIFWSPYLMNRTSGATPTMVVRNGGHLFEVLSEHFDSIWERRSVDVPLPTGP